MKGIYQIRNIENNKIYIGSSNDIENRWKQHKFDLNRNKHHSSKLQDDWNKYEEDCFMFEVLEEFKEATRDEIFLMEQKYLDQYKPHLNGYNMSSSSLPLKKLKLNKKANSDEFHVERTIRKIGNSLGILLPYDFLNNMKLTNGSVVNVSYKGGKIIIETEKEESGGKTFDEALNHIRAYLESNFEPKL